MPFRRGALNACPFGMKVFNVTGRVGVPADVPEERRVTWEEVGTPSPKTVVEAGVVGVRADVRGERRVTWEEVGAWSPKTDAEAGVVGVRADVRREERRVTWEEVGTPCPKTVVEAGVVGVQVGVPEVSWVAREVWRVVPEEEVPEGTPPAVAAVEAITTVWTTSDGRTIVRRNTWCVGWRSKQPSHMNPPLR
jgi:Ni,Fe-hydrogenase III small subunit